MLCIASLQSLLQCKHNNRPTGTGIPMWLQGWSLEWKYNKRLLHLQVNTHCIQHLYSKKVQGKCNATDFKLVYCVFVGIDYLILNWFCCRFGSAGMWRVHSGACPRLSQICRQWHRRSNLYQWDSSVNHFVVWILCLKGKTALIILLHASYPDKLCRWNIHCSNWIINMISHLLTLCYAGGWVVLVDFYLKSIQSDNQPTIMHVAINLIMSTFCSHRIYNGVAWVRQTCSEDPKPVCWYRWRDMNKLWIYRTWPNILLMW